MTIRSKITAAALGLVLATGVASAQTGTSTQTAPVAAQTQTDTGVKTAVQAPVKTVKIAHKTNRVHLTHRKVKHAKVARRSLRSKLAHKLGLKHFAKARLLKTHIVKAPVTEKHIAKSRFVGTQKHAAIAKSTIVR